MNDKTNEDMERRLKAMEQMLRNMRIAIILIAAFFVYQAIAPSGLWKGIEVRETVKLKELIVIDDHGNEWARLGAGNNGGVLVLDNEAGSRLKVSSDTIDFLQAGDTGHVEHLRIDKGGVIAP